MCLFQKVYQQHSPHRRGTEFTNMQSFITRREGNHSPTGAERMPRLFGRMRRGGRSSLKRERKPERYEGHVDHLQLCKTSACFQLFSLQSPSDSTRIDYSEQFLNQLEIQFHVFYFDQLFFLIFLSQFIFLNVNNLLSYIIFGFR